MCDRARSWIQKSNIWFRSHPFWPFWHFYCRDAPARMCKDQFHLGPYLWNICAASSVLDIVHIVPVPSPAMSTVPVPAKSKKEKTRDLKATLHSTANLNLKMTEHIGICWTCTCLLLVYHGLAFLHTTHNGFWKISAGVAALKVRLHDASAREQLMMIGSKLSNVPWTHCVSVLTFCDFIFAFCLPILSCLVSDGFQKRTKQVRTPNVKRRICIKLYQIAKKSRHLCGSAPLSERLGTDLTPWPPVTTSAPLQAHFPEFPEMVHLFPDVDVDLKSCRGGLVKFLFSKPLHWFLIVLLCLDVLLVITGWRCNMLQQFSIFFLPQTFASHRRIFDLCFLMLPDAAWCEVCSWRSRWLHWKEMRSHHVLDWLSRRATCRATSKSSSSTERLPERSWQTPCPAWGTRTGRWTDLISMWPSIHKYIYPIMGTLYSLLQVHL